MIIKCEQCQTKFRLDDSKVTDKGVKVRCAKCKHVFTVQNELPKTEQPEQSEFSSFLESAADQPRPEGTLIAGTESDATVPMPPFLYDSNNSDADATAAGTLQFESVPSDTPSDAFLNDSLPDPERSDVPFSFDSAAGESESSAGSELSPAMPEESGFGGFDSGENVTEDGQLEGSEPVAPGFSIDDLPEETVLQEPSAADEAATEVPQGFELPPGDDLFDTGLAPLSEEVVPSDSFDFGDAIFSDPNDEGRSGTVPNDFLSAEDDKAVEPSAPPDIDFGDELSAVVLPPPADFEENRPLSQEILFAPPEEARTDETGSESQPVVEALQEEIPQEELRNESSDAAIADEPAGSLQGETAALQEEPSPLQEGPPPLQEEPPPLPIVSRRKQSSLSSPLIAVVACAVLAVAGYLGFSTLSSGKGKVVEETGRISVRGVKSSFIKNSVSGELLVISGEALNEYTKPRAALQVKGVVYDAAGQILVDKSAFGGNPLTEEQLKTLPLDKLEAAMTNQFGDSLANLEVAPGKAVPFVIVISKVPAGARDFGVQAVGSTVATGKQQ